MSKVSFFLLLCFHAPLWGTSDSNSTLHPLIEKFDKDKDGKVFYTEAPKELQEDFCQYDVNQDGYLDEVEVLVIK